MHGRINQRECRKRDCQQKGSSINRDRLCSGLGLKNLKLMDTWLLILVQLPRPLQAKTVKDLLRKQLKR
ncbi:hypothetical protein L6452_08184 [Arctium lappa]|uniref:Uncharacterized protein n=1 Tax=Arctium lappa TaxID=4217 RepID=A0ACB9DGT3_ARCLA|nr:hypothetical protein L6452_08184 [Arctium lappa]